MIVTWTALADAAVVCGAGTQAVVVNGVEMCLSVASPAASPADPKSDFTRLEQHVEDTSNLVHDLEWILGLILVVGFGASTFSWFTTTRRESKLAIAGETASQARAQQVHEGFLGQVAQAKETLDLVNATLSLAERASRRAAEAVVEKARIKRAQLDTQSRQLLEDVRHRDDRALVAEPKLRERLSALAEKTIGFENSQFILPEEVVLTPAALFVAAMAAHLKGHFEEAFDDWNQVALSPSAEPLLRSSARYWIGYEHNNLGDFDQAQASFQLALDAVRSADPLPVARAYDIRRIIIETGFFADEDEAGLIRQLDALLDELRSERPNTETNEVLAKVTATLGNVCHVAATSAEETASGALYERAVSLFEEFADSSDWSRFGLAEALYALPARRDEGIALFRDQVRTDAQIEFDRREEPRSKFRARAAELIACLRVPEFNEEVLAVASDVRDTLAPLEERLTVYWPPKRKNVRKSTIRDVELPALLAKANLEYAVRRKSAGPERPTASS
jgi:tetratricopeptide (TPR) repeat protein